MIFGFYNCSVSDGDTGWTVKLLGSICHGVDIFIFSMVSELA